MRVLVVGGNGFLGKEIVQNLMASGNSVKSMSRSSVRNDLSDQVIGDIAKPKTYMDLLSGWNPEIVIQCAWVTEQKIYRESPQNESFAAQTLEFAENCYKTSTRHFIGLGSSAEYGTLQETCNAATTIPRPEDSYGRHKYQTYLGLHQIADNYGKRLTWARIFQPYGRGQDEDRLIPWAIKKLFVGEEILLNNPDTTLDWISSRDIARGIAWATVQDTPEAIDLGTSIGSTVEQVLKKLASLMKIDPKMIVTGDEYDPDKPGTRLVVSKTSPLLKDGWLPKETLTTGLSWILGL